MRAGVLAALVLTLVPSSYAQGPATSAPRPTSTRWAGYVAFASRDGAFATVSANWVQPRIRCDVPSSSAAFWIGLGGAVPGATGLEQIGTSADCSDSFLPSYSAWYELIPVPAEAVQVPITVAPGDRLAARVVVRGASVTFTMRNLTRRTSFATSVAVAQLDVSSAEWIAEAPSFCLPQCTLLALPHFGTVTFRSASASDSSHAGVITDPSWAHERIRLATTAAQPTALPSALTARGDSFSVRWRAARGS